MALKVLKKRQTATVCRLPFLWKEKVISWLKKAAVEYWSGRRGKKQARGHPCSDGYIDLSDPSEEQSSGNNDKSEYSSDKGEHSPSRKRAKMD